MPASLHALIASRLDGLEAADRSLLQAASVIGKTFSVDALAAVSGQAHRRRAPRLRELVRREMLTLEADPRSPEQGQYGFVQGLIREVAYGTLAKRDRRRLHIAAARYFEALDDEGIAGALAEHYVAAYKAQPEGPEGDAVAAQARVALRGAAERARSLGSFVQAMRFLEQALEVTTDPARAGAAPCRGRRRRLYAGYVEEPIAHTATALELAREVGDRRRSWRRSSVRAGDQRRGPHCRGGRAPRARARRISRPRRHAGVRPAQRRAGALLPAAEPADDAIRARR